MIDDNIAEQILAQERELSNLKALQPVDGKLIQMIQSTGSKTYPVIGNMEYYAIVKVTFRFGDSGYFLGDVRVINDRFSYAGNNLCWRQPGDGTAHSYIPIFGGLTVAQTLQATAIGDKAGTFTFDIFAETS